jgi:hypothetical protein
MSSKITWGCVEPVAPSDGLVTTYPFFLLFIINRAQSAPDVELCSFYEEYDRSGTDAVMAHGIYSLDDLKSTQHITQSHIHRDTITQRETQVNTHRDTKHTETHLL